MRKVDLENLKPGMVLAATVMGANNVSISKGTELGNRNIALLKNKRFFQIKEVQIQDKGGAHGGNSLRIGRAESEKEFSGLEGAEVPHFRYNGSFYEATDLIDIDEPIKVPGNAFVNGTLKNCPQVLIKGSLNVNGDISDCNILTAGDIQVEGNIKNTIRDYKINSYGWIQVHYIVNCTVFADTLRVDGGIENSVIQVDKNIEGPHAQFISNSTIQAGFNIRLGSVGQDSKLVLYNDKQNSLVQNLFEIEGKIAHYNKELAPLIQSVNVYRILREKGIVMTKGKKEELEKRFISLKSKLLEKDSFRKQSLRIREYLDKLKSSRAQNPIIIDDVIERGTKVVIDYSTLHVSVKERGVVFYKKGIIIMGKIPKDISA